VFSTQDATSKFLVQSDVSPYQMTMMRFWAFAAFSLLLAWRQGGLRDAFRSKHPVLQVARGGLLVVDIWMYVLALSTVSLAAVQSITLIYPLLVTIFAIPLLGEKVGVFRIVAVIAGFAGALLIVRPGGVPFDLGVIYAAGSGSAYALYIVLTRKVSASDTTTTSMVYTGVVGLVISSAVGVFHWQMLDATSFLLIGYIMLTGVVAHGMMIVALSTAPASVLQPFNYTSLPWAILLSVVLFHEAIDAISLLGAAIIVGAGLVVMARERLKKVPPASAEPALPGKE
jgi:drug/metabolite transporter (DMT)-like permease